MNIACPAAAASQPHHSLLGGSVPSHADLLHAGPNEDGQEQLRYKVRAERLPADGLLFYTLSRPCCRSTGLPASQRSLARSCAQLLLPPLCLPSGCQVDRLLEGADAVVHVLDYTKLKTWWGSTDALGCSACSEFHRTEPVCPWRTMLQASL